MITLVLLDWVLALSADEAGIDDEVPKPIASAVQHLPLPPPPPPTSSALDASGLRSFRAARSAAPEVQAASLEDLSACSSFELWPGRQGFACDSLATILVCMSGLLPFAHVGCVLATWRKDLANAAVYVEWLQQVGTGLAVLTLVADGCLMGLFARGAPAAWSSLMALRRQQSKPELSTSAESEAALGHWRVF